MTCAHIITVKSKCHMSIWPKKCLNVYITRALPKLERFKIDHSNWYGNMVLVLHFEWTFATPSSHIVFLLQLTQMLCTRTHFKQLTAIHFKKMLNVTPLGKFRRSSELTQRGTTFFELIRGSSKVYSSIITQIRTFYERFNY